jgi:hypothetical protein
MQTLTALIKIENIRAAAGAYLLMNTRPLFD